MTPLRRNAVVALLDAALPNHARLPIMAQSPWDEPYLFKVLFGA